MIVNNGFEVTLDNVNPDGRQIRLYGDFPTIKLKGTSRLSYINAAGSNVTIDEAETGGTMIVIDDVGGNYVINVIDGSFTINGGTLKVKNTSAQEGSHALKGNLTVNGGDVYLDGSGKAVVGDITANNVTIYEWDNEWKALENQATRYITTDNSSGNPTDPANPKWNW